MSLLKLVFGRYMYSKILVPGIKVIADQNVLIVPRVPQMQCQDV